MTWPLRHNTDGQVVPLGPFVDYDEDTGALVPAESLTITASDIRLHKSGTTTEVAKASGGATHMAGGRYHCTLSAADTDTLGPLRIAVAVAGALHEWLDCIVYPQDVYDALFAGTGDGIRSLATNMRGTDGANTISPDNATIASLGSALPLLLSYTQNADDQSAVLVGRLTDARAGYLDKLNVSGTLAHSDAAATYRADVSGLSTLTASQVWAHADRSLTGVTFPVNFADLDIDSEGRVTTANPATGGGEGPSVADIAAAILVTPANKLDTNAAGEVVASNMRGTDNAITTLGETAPAGWINAAAIASSAITDQKIASNAITAAKIASNAITSAKIASGAITSAKLAAGALDAVWSTATRTLTETADSTGVTTLLARITGLLRTKAEDESAEALQTSTITASVSAINDLPDADDVATAVQLKLATELARIDQPISSRLASAAYTAPDNAGVEAAKDAAEAAATLLDALTEIDSEQLRFTEKALELAPTGSGGGGDSVWSTGQRNQVLADAAAAKVAAESLVGTVATLDKQDDILQAISELVLEGGGGGGGGGGALVAGVAQVAWRSTADTQPLRFPWPVTGATITVRRSINGGDFEEADGVVSFSRSESGVHWYSLAFAVSDRPNSAGTVVEGTVRYELSDGERTRYANLQVYALPPSDVATAAAQAETLLYAKIAAQSTQR